MTSMWQNTPSASLESGCYDGISPVSELKHHGDLGIGAFHELGGEMTGVDGVFYRVLEDASARPAEDSELLAFCMVTPFVDPESFALQAGISDESFPAFMDAKLGTANYFYSLRLDGTFTNVRTRCFPKQTKPYPPLVEVMKTQPTFSYDRVEGTMVGFRAPSYVGNMTPPGYHLHLISADRSFGGHVMSFEAADVTVGALRIKRHEIAYPYMGDFASKSLD
ncbi:MAG: acetolactate decarboxylase [Actinomycetota bacterium]|nr:acetolactate decarboxylase [Actinomycetota bacterium]